MLYEVHMNQANYREVVSGWIQKKHQNSFQVISNFGDNKTSIGGIYPDIIMYDINDTKKEVPVFIIEVKRNGDIAPCLQTWKLQSSIPAILYIVVPHNETATAKSIANAVGISVKFGSYTLDDHNNVTRVLFNV